MTFDYKFGTGILFFTPSNTNASIQIGEIQDVTISSKRDLKKLYGQYSEAIDGALGKRDTNGKFSFARITTQALALYFQQSSFASIITSGASQQPNREVFTIPTAPYTATVANASKYSRTLGVNQLQSNNTVKQMTQLASGTPTTGQYTVSAGVYTFAAADVGSVVEINYISTNTTGNTITTVNNLIGDTPEFKLDLYQIYKTGTLLATLPRVIIPSFDLNLKLDDYTLPSSSFEVLATPVTGPIIFYN